MALSPHLSPGLSIPRRVKQPNRAHNARAGTGTPRAFLGGRKALSLTYDTVCAVVRCGSRKPLPTGASLRHRPPTATTLGGRRHGRRAISDLTGRASGNSVPVAPAPNPSPMLARAYFQLVDAIAAAHTEDELAEIRTRIAATAMHPFERKALERQVRARELALQVELEL